VFSLAFEYVDRILYARLQNRKGPPWYQSLADIVKLLFKETIVPEEADAKLFRAIPVFGFASALTAYLYIPIWSQHSLYSFNCDLIVIIYLLTIPTLCFFLAGWFSSSLYAEIGAIRTLTQLFAYEVPFYMALLGPALLANSWSIDGIITYFHEHPLLVLVNIPGFFVVMVAAQGKLERAPFDLPEAETEIVGGTFTEYSGRLLGIFKMTINVELIVVSSIIAAVYFPVFIAGNAIIGFALYIVKMLVIMFILTLMRAALARFRMDQMVAFCWKVLAPISLGQILIDLILKGGFFS
jgi:NADH-quinone oxidoreductase subunit H